MCHSKICFVKGCSISCNAEQRIMRECTESSGVTIREKLKYLLICVRLLFVLEPAGSAPCWWRSKSFTDFRSLTCSLKTIIPVWVHCSSVFSVSCRRGRGTRSSSHRVKWWDTPTRLKLRRAQSEEISACTSAGEAIHHTTQCRSHADYMCESCWWSWR